MSHNSQKAFPDGYPISEKKARAQIGVTRDEMRALRNTHLTEKTHYARGKQQSVWLNAAGLDALLKAIALRAAEQEKRAETPNALVCDPVKAQLLSLLTERIAVLQKTPATCQVRVVSANLQFKHMLIACALDDDHFRPARPLRVRVNNNANFVRGMQIPVQLVAGYTDLFELTRKCPRQKGKW
jgi:hypothetical protein